MHFIISFAYGKKTKLIMDFKDRYPFISEAELNTIYHSIQDVPINQRRPSDLNPKSLDYVLRSVVGDTVLDAACGRGYLAEQIVKLGKSVIGLDVIVSEKMEKGVNYVCGDITNLPFENSCFDTVVCTHALEHIEDGNKALSELLRVAKKRVIVVMPCQREYRFTPDLHVRFLPYMYNFKKFIGIEEAQYDMHGNDFCCVIDRA